MNPEGATKELPNNRYIPTLLSAFKKGDLDIREYLDVLRGQYEAVEPQVLAFLPEDSRFERLRIETENLYETFPDPESRPPLFGLMIGVKDIFHVAGFPTHAGSQLPPEVIGGSEAKSVSQLREAGALILGKTVTTEFAYFAPGLTRNPHNQDHTPGGSSSGSAAAVGAGLAPFAFGTQTIGSISRPASFCGVVGYKPSYDRISRAGVIPLASSVDHIGFFTSDVPSVQLPAQILCRDWKDIAPPTDKPVLGIPNGPYLEKASEAMLAKFDSWCEKFDKAGYEVKRIDTMPDFKEIVRRHGFIVAAEAYQTHEIWFGEYENLYHEKTAALIERGKTLPADDLEKAIKGRETLRHDLTALMDEHGIDLWLSPGAPGAAPKGIESTGDPIMNLPWTHSGLPTLCIPGGFDQEGLPLGLQVAARWYADEALVNWGEDLETLIHV